MSLKSERSTLSPTHLLALKLAAGLIAGGVATVAKGQAESLLQPLAEKIWPPTPSEKKVPGADPDDHPENMPPSEIAAGAINMVADHSVAEDDDVVEATAAKLHWSMGLGSAVTYSVLSARYPRLRVGSGAVAGLGLYMATHASSLPAAGLQPVPWKMPKAAVAWEAASHVAYGVVLELVLRVEDRYSR